MQEADLPTWQLKVIPNVGFYKVLHLYLKRTWKTKSKVAIGKFYIAIDPKLKAKGSRPCNIYRFIDTICRSNKPAETPMVYGQVIDELQIMKTQLQHCSKNLGDNF